MALAVPSWLKVAPKTENTFQVPAYRARTLSLFLPSRIISIQQTWNIHATTVDA